MTYYQRIRKSWLTQLALPIAVLLGSLAVFALLIKFFKTEPVTAKESVAVPQVRTAIVQRHLEGLTVESDGSVVPYREIELSAEVAGRIIQRTDICRVGNYVTAGTLLIRIDPRDYELEEERLEKELQQATVALDELAQEIEGVESLIELAEKEVALRVREMNRQRNLVGVVTSTDMERAEANELAARNSLITLGKPPAVVDDQSRPLGRGSRPGQFKIEESSPGSRADNGCGTCRRCDCR